MQLMKSTEGKKFVLVLNDEQPETFVITLNKNELELVGLSLQCFGSRMIYNPDLREVATTISSIMWNRQREMLMAEQHEQGRSQDQNQNQKSPDKNIPDWKIGS